MMTEKKPKASPSGIKMLGMEGAGGSSTSEPDVRTQGGLERGESGRRRRDGELIDRQRDREAKRLHASLGNSESRSRL